jgi:hypothetical protein
MPPHVPYGLCGLPSWLWPKCNWLLRLGRSWGSYVVPMRWMVIYEYEVQGRALNLSSVKLPRPWSPWKSSPSMKNPHGRAGTQTRDLMIRGQKLWPLDHEAGQSPNMVCANFYCKHGKTDSVQVWKIQNVIHPYWISIEMCKSPMPSIQQLW